ncbi:MAG TPA: carboxypeptidase-like regulatory domain-containing protein, partial [Bacteroidetes bacterium]|nr:carboxypeptidase-like regulatory domain-containing protein [Bacteroidota bacterium]
MKTTTLTKSIFSAFLAVFIFSVTTLTAGEARVTENDTTRFTAVRGVVLNAETHQPVVFASVFIQGTNMGTVSNSNGRFLIKIPLQYSKKKLGFSSIGFKTRYISVSSLNKVSNKIYLTPAIIPIQEVVIRHLDPVRLLTSAVDRIPQNYSDQPVMMTGFYRESIKKNRKYLSVAEAVLNIYKGAYNKGVLNNDRVTIF